jgi:hypothetical protein
LNDALDALADAARSAPKAAPDDDANANHPKNPNSIAHVARTPGDFDPAARGV